MKSEQLARKIEELHDDAGVLRIEADSLWDDLMEKVNELRDIRDEIEDALHDLSVELEAENEDADDYYVEDTDEYSQAEERLDEILTWLDKLKVE